MNPRPPAPLDWLLVAVIALIWGGVFLFIKRAVQVFDPMQMGMWRMVIATAVYIPIGIAVWPKINWKHWKPFLVVAFCGSAIPNILFGIAQKHINSGLAGTLNSLTPLFTLITGVLFFRMNFSRQKTFGVLLGLLGALLLILFNAHGSGDYSNSWYALLCVVATVCYAINANTINRYLRDDHPAAIASAAFLLSGALFIAGLWWSGGWSVAWQHPDGLKALGYVAYLAIVSTALANILYFLLMQRTNTLFATSVTYLLPVMALLLGRYDGETIGPEDLLGTGIILTGLYLARK